MKLPFFTVGHSDRSLEAFIGLLNDADIALLADVRKMPRSRTNPQFNEATLPVALAPFDIAYEHVAALGGLRGPSRAVPDDVNGFWTNDSFHRYADYALSTAFRAGLDHLVEQGRRRRCAVMCAEAVWWRCHRRIVADYLIARGETVFHIIGPNRIEPARLTPGAAVQPDGTIVYPRTDANADADADAGIEAPDAGSRRTE
ncbi:DUF488 family protein [Burkholderia ubonensis]|uniref:DUF488 domain-containing protein n=1 Tax=Burkholderia ubonensis TaxID=101571 RepID=UPI0007564BA6|nr:DUF488 domain-containing protein [Burkholderia ubonensis]KWI13325.1 DNA repair protein [Burkholderia ubonensis]OJA99153.1 DNA repair protein [Burkholderia ubonensis]